ncbi:MAG TPA: bifunctional hydroxymethylpyrimidine kinase/phosphomethylpyrimidine kinase [Holophaga sp.]|nr:bifunctional hydroxymethylpyrimidine kinase/phosphomethylpyrimidine kinase [Holophaga sp.]
MDPSAGAGLLRDVMTLASLGISPMAVPVAETIQNGSACSFIDGPSCSPLLRLESLRGHLSGRWGLKLGMCALADEELWNLVNMALDLHPFACIWDPIQAPTAGVGLHDAGRLRRMAQILLPRGKWVVAPNRQEAALLAGLSRKGSATDDISRLASPFLELGADAVWIKGGHGEGDLIEDFWITPRGVASLGAFARLEGDRRGTGCSLASAWLAYRLLGHEPEPAAWRAVLWLRNQWPRAFAPGGFGRPSFSPGRS